MALPQDIIKDAFERRHELSSSSESHQLRQTLGDVFNQLNQGQLRVCEKIDGEWITHEWIKQAILLYFKLNDNTLLSGAYSEFYDKIPMKFSQFSANDFQKLKIRAVPGAHVRFGSFVGPNTILMPSFVNIGAYVDEGTLVDTWATVGSCAQIGKHVHLSGGVGIGGVLEPLQSRPTIIEDHCFIGARSEIVEGVIVEEGSVIGMGVYIGQSTKIYDRETGHIYFGRVPKGSVVVPGSLPDKQGGCQLYCAVIIKKVDQKTREKTALNELLRDE